MQSRTIRPLALGLALMMGGCAAVTPGTTPGPVITLPAVQAEIDAIIAATKAQCSWIPDAASLANLIGSFIPGAAPVTSIVSQVANSICSQVLAKGLRYGGPQQVVVNGIPIDGHYAAGGRRGVSINGITITGHHGARY